MWFCDQKCCVVDFEVMSKKMSSIPLRIVYFKDAQQSAPFDRVLPLAKSPTAKLLRAPIKSALNMTSGRKRVYKLTLDIKNVGTDFVPGDTIAILPCNNDEEINELIIRLHQESNAERFCVIQVDEDCLKPKTVPKHFPSQPTTILELFRSFLDIRSVPKKLFLKSLLNYVQDSSEKERFEKILQPSDYIAFISSFRGLLDLLNEFPSCVPPMELIFQHLPPLLPRPYSIASSPLREDEMDVVFDVTELPNGRKGVCTGWLVEEIERFHRNIIVNIPFYFRKSHHFTLPSNLETPVILIATGTGLAPFLGFLEHRSLIKRSEQHFGDCILIYGCREPSELFAREDLESYLEMGVLSGLKIKFSQTDEEREYVTDALEKFGEEYVDYMTNHEAVTYFCGNMKTSGASVRAKVVENFVKFAGMEENAAEEHVRQLQKSGKYAVDWWL